MCVKTNVGKKMWKGLLGWMHVGPCHCFCELCIKSCGAFAGLGWLGLTSQVMEHNFKQRVHLAVRVELKKKKKDPCY